MNQTIDGAREKIVLVATNPMRIAGLQGFYGDPCGMEFIPVSPPEALCLSFEPQYGQQTVVLIDAGSCGPLFELLSRFHVTYPRTRVVVIGMDADDTYVECVISAGARGFIPATANLQEFSDALDTVRDGAIWAPRKVLSHLIGRRSGISGLGGIASVPLTPREGEVLRLLMGGQCNREIGARLGIYPNTVKGHLSRIMRKAGVGNRVELTMFALQRNLQPRRHQSGPRASP
jgi:DNA-binding NarL/FixJ family response regulator